jgi:hypothetical protein
MSATNSGGVAGTPEDASGGARNEATTFRSKVVHEAGQYLVFGTQEHTTRPSEGFILSSTDASHWKLVHRGEGEYFTSVTRSDTAWYALGDVFDQSSRTSQPLFLRSEDGERWTVVTPPNSWSFQSVFWTGELLLATGSEGDRTLFLQSEDGQAWTERSNSPVYDLTRLRGTKLVVGTDGNQLFRSADGGRTFEKRALPTSVEPLGNVAGVWSTASGFEGTTSFDCCFGELPGNIRYYELRSSDGDEWSVEATTRAAPIQAVERDGVSVGIDTNFVLVSRAAASEEWSYRDVGAVSSVTVGERFVAVSSGDRVGIRFSDDGISWMPAESVEEPE